MVYYSKYSHFGGAMSYSKTVTAIDPAVTRQVILRQRYLAYKAQKEEENTVDVGPHDQLLFGEHPTYYPRGHVQLPGCP